MTCKRIFIIGHPGTGKAVLAKAMEQLGCTSSKELIALYYDQP